MKKVLFINANFYMNEIFELAKTRQNSKNSFYVFDVLYCEFYTKLKKEMFCQHNVTVISIILC